MNTFKRLLIGIIISFSIAIPALWAATYTIQKLVVTDNVKVDTLQSNTSTDTVTIVQLSDSVTKKHAGSHSGTAGKLSMFTGTNTLGDSGQTDTQARTKHYSGIIMDASTLTDTTLMIGKPASAITIIEVYFSCKTDPDTEIAGDVIYVDSFISQANPHVINSFDTTSGMRDDTTIDTPAVPTGKCVEIKFDVTPIAAIKQIFFDIRYLIN